MKHTTLLPAFLIIFIFLVSCNTRPGKPRILVFSKTAGYHHEAIPAGIAAIVKLGQENDFETDTTSDAAMFNEDSLQQFAAVVFLNTTDTGDVLLNNYQRADFTRYIEAGGGFVGIHAATDAGYQWGWYARLVGATFNGHPEQQQATLDVVDKDNNATKHLPAQWSRKDEWYNFKNLNPDVHVLLKIDEKSYKGGTNGSNHPMAWYHEYDGGRAFYTELGHTVESYTDPNYLKHILGGIKYAIGDNKKPDYAKAKTERVPDEDRFTKTQLVQATFFEPTEMTILPNLDILVTQRRGEFLLYKNDTKTIRQVGFLNVYYKTAGGVNAEEGLLGIQADPDFNKNHFVYVYYSPADTSVNRLSRFTFENDTLKASSEKIILQLYSQRGICCHTGGSVAFGKDHLLYVSTGDNSTPFDENKQPYVSHGFAPLDDRPGHLQYDVRRSAGNTNDLRGKILRIKVNEDGTYSIPEGNLFAKGTDKTRPEIYVMGDRNPYRISVDKKNGNLYWGEVGPDANSDSLDTRGPRGYDEVNQARKAGFFGWPLFIANNLPYHAYDYATGTSGAAFDPAKPINNSRNNTGLQQLPPAQPAFIYYPYGDSKAFPQVGSGGRTAMAGPVYYTDLYAKDTRMPDYYNNKLFIYEWIRGWIKVVTMKENGDFDMMEPFMEHTKFNNPVDMEVGPDGKLYVLEYGAGWFAKNPDAGLARIDYNAGNRPPVVSDLKVDKTSGLLPLTIHASVKAKDPDQDKIKYTWNLGDGLTKETDVPELTYTLSRAGDYPVSVQAKDAHNAIAKSDVINVYAGNEAPEVSVHISGNQSFYFAGTPVQYKVDITDKDDTAKVKDLSSLVVSADYYEGTDKAGMPQEHQMLSEMLKGKNLMLSMDCKGCHKVDEKSIGPAFTAVAAKYVHDNNAVTYLTQKIIKGGSGVWGDVPMAAHPNLKEADAHQIINWIRSLAAGSNKVKSLPASGTLNATMNKPVKENGLLYISAAYTDKGGVNIQPLLGTGSVTLRNSKISFEGIAHMLEFSKDFDNGTAFMTVPKTSGWFSIDSVDLSGITKAALTISYGKQPVAAYSFELHLDAPDGKKIGSFEFAGAPGKLGETPANAKPHVQALTTIIAATGNNKFHNVYLVSKSKGNTPSEDVALSSLQFFLK